MATTSLSPEQEEYLAYIVSSAEQLKHVVSDILDFKQLGTELVIEKQPISIRECLVESLQQSGIMTISGSGAAGVHFHVDDDVPEFIMSDRGRIVQVFVNLIHNTMRYTQRDSRHVSITIENAGFLPPSPPISPSSTIPTATTTTHQTPDDNSTNVPADSPSPTPSTIVIPSTTQTLPIPISPLTPVSPPFSSYHPLTTSAHLSSATSPPTPRLDFPSSPPSTALVLSSTPSSSSSSLLPSASPSLSSIMPTTRDPKTTLTPLITPIIEHEPDYLRCLLRITVRDNGVGIDPAALSSVFQPDNSLSKTKHVVELLGGDINIESEGLGKGTEVIVMLKSDIYVPSSSPVQLKTTSPPPSASPRHSTPFNPAPFLYSPSSAPPLPASSVISSSKDPKLARLFKDLKVLLVEDNLMNQKVIRRLFSKLGIFPDVASHGAEAVDYVRNKKYDIVFMDLHMPVCDGFEATRQIQDLPSPHHKPPIYALTASVNVADRVKCMQLGMKGHLLKPVSVQALVDAISSVRVS